MLPEIKFTITKNNKLIESYSQTTDFQNLSESLDKFELEFNAAITKLIQDAGDLSGKCNVDEDNDDSETEDQDEQISPKKKKIT